MRLIPHWPPRDWRMLLALFGLAIAGAGAWPLAKWSLDYLSAQADRLNSGWPLAYCAYGALILLAIPSACFGVVLGLKSFSWEGPGGIKGEITGDSDA